MKKIIRYISYNKIKTLYSIIINFISKQNKYNKSKFEIISHEENYNGTGKIYVKSRIKGTRNIFNKPVSELYQADWISNFSHEDAAFLGILYVSEKQSDIKTISLFPRKKYRVTKNVILMGMLFITFLNLSNLTASKILSIHLPNILSFLNISTLTFPAALIFFPLTYNLDDTLTEVYGFEISRYIIWVGLVCNAILSFGIFLSIKTSPASFWAYQNEYEAILGSTYRIFFASFFATFFGEFCNAIILSKIKVLTSGKWLWLRIITSSSIGVAVDSIIFCIIAFSGILTYQTIKTMIFTQYIFKISYEILALPITYLITGYLKHKDKIDFYDYSTNFNPFSLKLNENGDK